MGLHLHLSAAHVGYTFVGVLLMGTLWRLGSGYLIQHNPEGSFLHAMGQAAAVQY